MNLLVKLALLDGCNALICKHANFDLSFFNIAVAQCPRMFVAVEIFFVDYDNLLTFSFANFFLFDSVCWNSELLTTSLTGDGFIFAVYRYSNKRFYSVGAGCEAIE